MRCGWPGGLLVLGALLMGTGGNEAAARLETPRNGRDGAELVLVPAGNYRAENILLNAPVVRRLERYHIYKYLVTVGQYRRFCRAAGREVPKQPDLKATKELLPAHWFRSEESVPVSNVTWDEAVAYCRWAGGVLPTDGQWEKAAWGERDRRKNPDSPFGVEDLLAPIRQWCEFNEEDRNSPELQGPNRQGLRSIRGTYGPFDPDPHSHSALTQGRHGQSFRCVLTTGAFSANNHPLNGTTKQAIRGE